MTSNLHFTCFYWQAVQATYRLEEMANDQSRTLDLKRNKHLDATRTLKNSEADLLKAREDLNEVTRARDNAKSGLASAQKQAEDQTRRLLEAEEHSSHHLLIGGTCVLQAKHHYFVVIVPNMRHKGCLLLILQGQRYLMGALKGI